jgi:dTDP-4-amino-4,6-dideoxygalactose transaminase
MRVGGFGAAEVLSFHATKFINAFEGGAIVTNDADLAQRLREMRAFGIDDDAWVAELGTNAKMSEVSAVMGLHSLGQIGEITATNRRNLQAYREHLRDCPGIVLRAPADPGHSNCQYVVCEIDETVAGISRDEVLSIIEAEGVLAKRYFYPGCHRADPYWEKHKKQNTPLPVTERLTRTTLVLPTGLGVDKAQIATICGMLAYVIEMSNGIREKLRDHRSHNNAA